VNTIFVFQSSLLLETRDPARWILKSKSIYAILAGLLMMLSVNSFSQKQKPKNDSWYDDKPLHFGFSLGANLMDFNINPSHPEDLLPEVSLLNPGINIQIVSNLKLHKYFDLRFLPGVSFGQRNVRFYQNQVIYNEHQRLESSFLEFPLLLKYKGARLNNVRPYIIGGINIRYDLAGKKNYDEEKEIWLRLRRLDLYYEFGAGLDFYLPYFKLSVELKMSNGIRDVLVHDPASGHQEYVNAINRIQSQIWVLAFHFE
jgi:hypothetical protein